MENVLRFFGVFNLKKTKEKEFKKKSFVDKLNFNFIFIAFFMFMNIFLKRKKEIVIEENKINERKK